MESRKKAWSWIPSLYLAEGLPYVAVMTISVIMYKKLGISNTDIALYTSWLYLPWVIKPFWSPFVDLIKTKRWWIVTMQLLIGAGFAGVAFTLPINSFFAWSLAMFWLVAFSSATHDIAADGFYMLALDEQDQAFFVGIRSTFYRIATIAGQGLLVMLAGVLEQRMSVNIAWSITFYIISALFIAFFLYHKFVLLLPQETCIDSHFVHAAIPLARGTVGKAYQSLPIRSSRARRFGTQYLGSRFRIWHHRHHWPDNRRHHWRYLCLKRRITTLVVAHGTESCVT